MGAGRNSVEAAVGFAVFLCSGVPPLVLQLGSNKQWPGSLRSPQRRSRAVQQCMLSETLPWQGRSRNGQRLRQQRSTAVVSSGGNARHQYQQWLFVSAVLLFVASGSAAVVIETASIWVHAGAWCFGALAILVCSGVLAFRCSGDSAPRGYQKPRSAQAVHTHPRHRSQCLWIVQ